MALIQCPECGKEVSDRAPKCPGCGFPIKSDLKKVVPMECPECGTKVEPALSTCPNCGYLMKKNSAKEILNKTGSILGDGGSKRNLKKIIAISIIVLIIVVIIFCGKRTSKFDFVEFLGKDYVELPKSVVIEEYIEDSFEATQKSPVYLCGIKGEIIYYYSMDGLLSIPGIVDDIYWEKDDWAPTDQEIEKIRKKLNDIYGTYDYSEKFDSDDRDYYRENEFQTEYYWNNREGIDITLSVNEYGHEKSVIVNWEESSNGID